VADIAGMPAGSTRPPMTHLQHQPRLSRTTIVHLKFIEKSAHWPPRIASNTIML
jgi:hypothetical protein